MEYNALMKLVQEIWRTPRETPADHFDDLEHPQRAC